MENMLSTSVETLQLVSKERSDRKKSIASPIMRVARNLATGGLSLVLLSYSIRKWVKMKFQLQKRIVYRLNVA